MEQRHKAAIARLDATEKQGIHRPHVDSAAIVATWEVTLRAQKAVPRVCWPATGITAHRL